MIVEPIIEIISLTRNWHFRLEVGRGCEKLLLNNMDLKVGIVGMKIL